MMNGKFRGMLRLRVYREYKNIINRIKVCRLSKMSGSLDGNVERKGTEEYAWAKTEKAGRRVRGS